MGLFQSEKYADWTLIKREDYTPSSSFSADWDYAACTDRINISGELEKYRKVIGIFYQHILDSNNNTIGYRVLGSTMALSSTLQNGVEDTAENELQITACAAGKSGSNCSRVSAHFFNRSGSYTMRIYYYQNAPTKITPCYKYRFELYGIK